MKKLLFKKSRIALFIVFVLVLSQMTAFANPLLTTMSQPSEQEITFTGHSSLGMGGSATGTDLKLVLESGNKFRLETTKPRGTGIYEITEQQGIYNITFTFDDVVNEEQLKMTGIISTNDLTADEISIKIENVVYNIASMGVMQMGEVEFIKVSPDAEIKAVDTNVVYKGKASFGMQPGSFTAMTLTIMPDMRFSVETTKPRGEGSYEIIVNEDGTNAISFTYDSKDSDGNALIMTGSVSDVDLSKVNATIEIKNATYPLNGMKPLNLGYVEFISPVDTPSMTYMADIEAAISKGLILEELQNSYNLSLTRQEAGELIVNLIEKAEGKTIDEIINSRGLTINDARFEDCTSKAINALEALKIVNGVSKTNFAPHELVNNEQFAVMLSNVLRQYYGYSDDNKQPLAMDAAGISEWAKQAVATVLGLEIEGNSLMNTERGLFNPKNHISREKAFTIILNLSNYK